MFFFPVIRIKGLLFTTHDPDSLSSPILIRQGVLSDACSTRMNNTFDPHITHQIIKRGEGYQALMCLQMSCYVLPSSPNSSSGGSSSSLVPTLTICLLLSQQLLYCHSFPSLESAVFCSLWMAMKRGQGEKLNRRLWKNSSPTEFLPTSASTSSFLFPSFPFFRRLFFSLAYYSYYWLSFIPDFHSSIWTNTSGPREK